MSTIVSQDPSHPHIVKLIGGVINANGELDRNEVTDALFSTSSPLGNLRGKVDFIIVYNLHGGTRPTFASTDHTLLPRPLRGIVDHSKFDMPSYVLLWNMPAHLTGLTHEICHYWLNRTSLGNAKINTANGLVETPTSREIWESLNRGNPIPEYPLVGREDGHWSPFVDGQDSPMESGKYGQEQLTEGLGLFGRSKRYSQVQFERKTGPTFFVPGPGGGDVSMGTRFNGFERWLMGDITLPYQTAPGGWPSLRVMEPRWIFPLGFQAGIYLETTDGRRFYFGYDQGPHQIAAQQSNGSYSSPAIQLPIQPFQPHNQIGLKILQLGQQIHFQVRVRRPVSRLLQNYYLWTSKPEVTYDNLVRQGGTVVDRQADFYRNWRTLDSITGMVARVGISTRRTSVEGYGAPYVRLKAEKLCLFDLQTINDEILLEEEIPIPGPSRISQTEFIMPYAHDQAQSFDYFEDSQRHNAPKWTRAAPRGNFAFAGLISIDACSVSASAGGSPVHAGTMAHMVGTLRSIQYNDFIFPPDPDKAIRAVDPLQGFYKVMFCAAARQDSEITSSDLSCIDVFRRAWEIGFSLITNRAASTAILNLVGDHIVQFDLARADLAGGYTAPYRYEARTHDASGPPQVVWTVDHGMVVRTGLSSEGHPWADVKFKPRGPLRVGQWEDHRVSVHVTYTDGMTATEELSIKLKIIDSRT